MEQLAIKTLDGIRNSILIKHGILFYEQPKLF